MPLVHALDDAVQPHRIDIPNARCVWIITHMQWIARKPENVAYSQCVRTQQFRLQGHQIAVPRSKMDDSFHTKMVLNQPCKPHTTHAHTRHRTISNVDTISPSL